MSLLLLGANQFNVKQDLFANNEQGLWLDPSDMTAGKAGWRRNLLSYTEQFDNSYWTKQQSTCVANSANSPFGDQTADLVYPSGDTSFQGLARTAGATFQRLPHRFSIYAKASGKNWLYFFNINFVGGNGGVWFDLQAGTVGAVTGAWSNATIESVGNGWYRCSATATPGGTSDYIYFLAGDNNNSANCTPNATDGLLLYGAQLELGSTPSEYQPITDFSTEFKAAFPTHTLYQDSTGVTPCTAAGDPVGLILDQSRGGLSQIGAELVTNGGFDSDSSWSKDSGWQISGGVLSKPVADGTTSSTNQTVAITGGKWYRVTFTATISAGEIRINLGSTTTKFSTTSSGTHTVFVFADSTTSLFYFRGGTTFAGSVDNVSIREVPGNHAFQTTSASRPTLARIPSSGRRNLLTRTEEFDNAAWTKTTATLTAGVADPNGGNTAWTFTAAGASSVVNQIFNGLSGSLTNSIWIRRRTGTGVVRFYTGAASATQQMQSVITNDWQRLSTATGTASGASDRFGIILETSGDAVDIWRPQLETGSTATSYQKVVATTDVTESGVSDLWHLVFDGSDDSLTTNSISFNTWTQDTRRNLLVDTESFGVSNWTKIAVTANDNATTDPNGGNTACRLVETTAASEHRLDLTTGLSFTSGLTYTVSIYAKAAERTRIRFGFSELFQMPGRAYFDLSNGTTDNAIAGTTAAIENAGNGWYRCSVTCTCTGNITSKIEVNLVSIGTTVNYTGDTANGVLVWGAQLESGSLTAYQRVGTDEMTVIAGVRKVDATSGGMIAELTANSTSNNQSFWLYDGLANGTVGDKMSYRSKGTNSVTVQGDVVSPKTVVLTGISDISNDETAVRVNGAQSQSSSSDQGTGNFANAVLYIGRRGSVDLPFRGHIYQLIIRGKTTPTGKLLEAERFVGRKTGVSF